MKNIISKPLLRGHFHQAGFFIALGACSMLIAGAQTKTSFTVSLIYSLSLLFLLGVSSLYHRVTWDNSKRMLMKRLDHSAIFVLISGTVTAVCVLSLESNLAFHIVFLTWLFAFVGILQKIIWPQTPKWISSCIYVCAGWIVLPYFSEFNRVLDGLTMLSIVGGGVVYTIGAVIYACKRPNPFPKFFGYHEIFHIFVNIGALFHFVAVYRLMK